MEIYVVVFLEIKLSSATFFNTTRSLFLGKGGGVSEQERQGGVKIDRRNSFDPHAALLDSAKFTQIEYV